MSTNFFARARAMESTDACHLSLLSSNHVPENRNRTVLPERRVRSRETFVLLGRAPGKRCRQITIRRKRKRKRRASEYYERAKTTRTFNASG